MNLVQKEYNLIKEGKGSKAHFLKLAKMNFPKHIGTTNTFDQVVTILTGKSLLSEGIGGYVDLQPNTTQSWFNIFEAEVKAEMKEITESVAQRLLDYQWPGNVRELRNAMERAVTLSEGTKLRIEDLPDSIRNYQSRTMVIASDKPEELRSLEEVEKRYILHVLDTVDGNRTVASKILGLDRKTLYRKLIRYEQTDSQ